jgi:hypothetical protein
MAGMAAQGRWRRRRPASLVRRHGVALCERGTGVRPPLRVPPSSFEGVARRPYGSGWHNVMELTLALLHSVLQWWGWPHLEGWRTTPGHDSQARQRDGMHGFVFDLGACGCQSIKCPSRGSRYGGGEPVRASSEAGTHPRG